MKLASASSFSRLGAATFLSVGLAVAFAQLHADAQAADALPYSRSYMVTGNYAVGGVDITGSSVNGFSTGTISMNGVPADADIVAAYLYWETITSDLSQAAGVQFRGNNLDIADVVGVKRSSQPLSGQTASCWSSGSPVTVNMFRADVLRFLPMQRDANHVSTGKRLVNDTDLQANGYPLHSVRLPEFGTGNNVPESAGASLLVIYRDPNPDTTRNPLNKIVVYDGVWIQPQGAPMSQTLRGFYGSGTGTTRMTHIVASGAKNKTESVTFAGSTSLTFADPFPDAINAASDRAWASPTFNVTAAMPAIDRGDGYGETGVTTVTHAKTSPYDCLTWAAVVFSAPVLDVDGDGLPDALENSSTDGGTPWRDPDGAALPDLHAMGASSSHKDIFIEVNGMWAPAGTTYGSAAAPLSSTVASVTDPNGHNHLPTPEVIKIVAESYKNAPVANPDLTTGIAAHFDVGNILAYHALGGDYASTDADAYLLPSSLARGGELIHERACDPSISASCQFPAYPGTVGWKFGFEVYRDAPVDDSGQELASGALNDWIDGNPNTLTATHRRRFDRNRRGLFHYVLSAHAQGRPKSTDPSSPDFHVPRTTSGVADLAGPNVLLTLGLWDPVAFTASAFVRASTMFHELGHDLELWHGGPPPVWNTTTHLRYFEPNCKPDYPSVMSYLYQVNGLRDDNGTAHVDLSRVKADDVDETTLVDGSFATPMPYRSAWFAPLLPGTIGYSLGTPPARRFCSGSPLPSPLPVGWVPVGRIEAPSVSAPFDWNADGQMTSAYAQDVNFDGRLNGTFSGTPLLHGFNDWGNIRLNQLGAGRTVNRFSNGLDAPDAGADAPDAGLDAPDAGVDAPDAGLDAPDAGADAPDAGLDAPDAGADAPDAAIDLDLETAKALGSVPQELKACVLGVNCPDGASSPLHKVRLTWKAPNIGIVSSYAVYRVTGDTLTPGTIAAAVPLGTTTASTFVDTEELPNNVKFTYWVRADFSDDTQSGVSNFATITAVDDAPVAAADSYAFATGGPTTSLVVAARGVLLNDTDDDSPAATLKSVLVTGPSHAARFTLNADGSFSYTPAPGFKGVDSFTYVANDGAWPRNPAVRLSANSNAATVTITVTSGK